MASVSGTSGRTNYGISGLVSGMDTDTMVESMTAVTSNKIDKQNRQIQLLAWKQASYRTVTSGINEFVDKYLNSKSSSSILSGGFFSNYSSKASTEGIVKLSGSVEKSANVQINSVTSLASAASYTVTNSNLVNKLQIDTEKLAAFKWDSNGEAKVSFYLDGANKEVTLKKEDFINGNGTVKSNSEIAESLNATLLEQFKGNEGQALVKVDGNLNFTPVNASSTFAISKGGGDIFGISPDYGSQVTINNTLGSLGLTSSGVNENGKETYTLKINDNEWTFTEDDTINGIMKKVNAGTTGVTMSFSAISKTFSFKTTDTGSDKTIAMEGDLAEQLFGVGKENSDGFTVKKEDGKNMVANLTIDGVETTIERSGNTITFDGMTMEFTSVYSGKDEDGNDAPVTFTVDNDTDGIVEKMQEFIDDYNALINSIYTLITEKPDKDYEPLTDTEKEAMSETEIDKWEAKAKQGILYNDSTLTSLLSSMRSTMFGSIDGSIMAKFGISTVNTQLSSKTNNGQLELNADTFREALTNNTADLINVFTKDESGITYRATVGGTTEGNKLRQERTANSGLMQRLSDVFQDMVYTGTPKGTLLQIAGMAGNSSESDNQINKKITDANSEIDDLQDQLEMERTRYYNKFNAMEVALSKLNSSSSYIASMLGTNTSS